ncbi:hypothetical protein FSP39_005110 [Pinctada imbricata]|uniref:B box-type domain-containing protein n=1 Tax=Pinctada imbricata TaxID=66713 RepID=A0AA88XJA7_PINIB|nr:hypothetical protein FSP39_005110 [Pinctada imbricata]
MALSKPEDVLHAQTAVSCNVCETEAPGEHYCFDCNQNLCSNCETIHRKVASSKNHNVCLRTQIGEKYSKSLNCTDHGIPVTYHCEKCKAPVCGKCVTDQHKGHEMSDLDVVIQKKSTLLRKYTIKMQEDVLPTLSVRGEEVREGKEKYEKKICQIQQQMEDENEAQHKEIDVIYNERLKKLLKRKELDLSVFDRYSNEIKVRIERYEGRIGEYQNAIVKNSLPNVFEFAKTMDTLPEIGRTPEFPTPPSFLPGKVQNLRENLGYLKDSSISIDKKPIQSKQTKIPKVITRFKSPLKGKPSICISKKGSVLLGGDQSNEIVKIDKTGQILWRRNVQFSPLTLAVLENGDIIFAAASTKETKTVRRLPINGMEEILFNFEPTFSNGISVTSDQRLLICTRNGKVLRTNSNHDKVRHLYDGKEDGSALHAIETSDGSIYINDLYTPAILILKKDGTITTLKHTTKGEKFVELVGLAVDAEGNVLSADKGNNCVYIIDQTKQVQKLVDSSHGLQSPRFIAVDNENNLWITQYDETIVILKYL